MINPKMKLTMTDNVCKETNEQSKENEIIIK